MKLRVQATNAQNTRPTLDEIRQRALEIHVERGGDDSDLENYLDEWLQEEHELQEEYNKSSRE
jgi:serine protease inhibitor